MCEVYIQLCVISVELETNTRMILYDFTQWSSIWRICVSVTARMSTECTVTVSSMQGPLFLTDRQFTTPNEIGPGLREMSPQSNNKVARP